MNPVEPPDLPSNDPKPKEARKLEMKLPEIIDALMKRPTEISGELIAGRNQKLLAILAWGALAAFLAYGLLIGAFSGEMQWIAAPLKVAGGMLATMAICFPSLYILLCLAGAEVSMRAAFGLLVASVALAGLLLLGFAPIAWVFTQSTNSVTFIGALYLIIWLIAIGFGLSMLTGPFRRDSRMDSNYLVLWKGIFILVALQMTTTLRPIVGKSPEWLSSERKFFLSYWMENMSDPPKPTKSGDSSAN